jgi:lipopolysaccharide transport protein LptA
MRKAAVLTLICLSLAPGVSARAQKDAAPAKSPVAMPSRAKEQKTEPNKLLGTASQSNEPTTTEIYADEALFDSNKNVGVFTGHVKVVDPRFNLQSEKLTVFISKGENQGLEKAIAEGDVAMVRDRPDPNGGPPTRSVGRSDKAVYTSATGNVELTGTPRVQEGLNTHVATSSETVMVVNQNGQLTTHGPSRTEIRQQPKETPAEGKPAAKVSASPKP